MSISSRDVEHIAHLARLQVNAEDLPIYTEQLSRILGFVAELSQIDTKNIEPMAHPLDIHQPTRPDAVTEMDQHRLFQQNAPLVEAGLYLVPTVIE